MDTATDDPRGYHSRALSDPHFFRDSSLFQHWDDEMVFSNQMGSGRRDARVVCESFSTGRIFARGASPKVRQTEPRKNVKANLRRRTLAYTRNPLLACFVGESVFSSRPINLSPKCDSSGSSQRTFFSLIPVDRSRVNEKTGEPQSPQLSCIGQVKHRQVKTAKLAEAVSEKLARMEVNDQAIPRPTRSTKTTSGPRLQKEALCLQIQKPESFNLSKEESFKLQKVEAFKLRKEESFKVQKEESFKLQKEESRKNLQREAFSKLQNEVSFKLQKQDLPLPTVVDDIPYLDLAGDDMPNGDSTRAKNAARLMRSKRAGEEEEKTDDEEKVNSLGQKNSIRHINHFLKQKLGASMVKGGFVCGWSSSEDSPRSEHSETDSEQYEIDLSRFASGDMQPKTPSFRESRYYQQTTGKKLAEIRVHAHQIEGVDRRSWKDETQGKELNDISVDIVSQQTEDSSTVVTKSSPSKVILQPAGEATLWKRRCMPRPGSLEEKR